MSRHATNLPIESALDSILGAIQKEPRIIVAAPPGSGKTTGIPPALLQLLEGDQQIVLLQPRRMAARAVAGRLAFLLDTEVGQLVGYQVRQEKRWNASTKIVVMTYGILLRRLQSDPLMEQVRLVLLDEFHERSLEADLTLGMLLRVQTLRDDLGLAVMSATLDVDPISKFLQQPPVISVEGRAFPLRIQYQDRLSNQRIEDQVADALPAALRSTSGHVLVFLPGVGEIRRTARRISSLSCCRDAVIMELYGDLAPDRQDAVMKDIGSRKIILSTNVAETSITIPGVDCVIDSGQARIMKLNPIVGLPRLDIEPISQASAHQRAGRAGRTAPGVCYRLWMKAMDRARPEFDTPEILRGDLASAVLQLYGWGESDIAAFPWLTPPSPDAIAGAETLLERLGAIESGRITDMGRRMLSIPAHPRLARMLISAADAGIHRRACICAAMLSERDPFIDKSSGPKISRDHAKLLGLDAADVVGRAERMEQWIDGADDPAVDKNAAFAVKRTATQYLDSLAESLHQDREQSNSAGLDPSPQHASELLAKALLDAFPDRLAKLRQAGGDRGLMVGGQGVRFKNLPQNGTELFLCIELLQKTSDAEVRLAAAIDETWLPSRLMTTAEECFFHPSQRRVVARRRTYWLDLILSEKPVEVSDDKAAAKILYSEVRSRWDRIFPSDNKPLKQLIQRVRRYAQLAPDDEAPAMDQAWLMDVAEELCHGKRSLEEVQSGPWLDVVHSQLGYDFLHRLKTAMPESIRIPSGNEVAIEYTEGSQPAISVRLQELFGWLDTPRICNNRVPLLLKILAPNYREIQVTSDLASFWKSAYFEVRKELKRRYPKHHWPDDPLNAVATKSGLGRHAKPEGS